MSPAGARERRRHARNFARWCHAEDLAPLTARRDDVARYVEAAANGDARKASKIRCSLRAVGELVHPERSARVFGLGRQCSAFGGLPEPVARLVEATAQQQPARHAIRLSALRRLMRWAAEVDAAPETLSVTDLVQFRAWLHEVGAPAGETLVVARDFIELRWSPFGRALFGDRPAVPTRIQLEPPLSPRFG